MADTDESQSDGNAAEAFEHLTEEVTVLHHTVEELVDVGPAKAGLGNGLYPELPAVVEPRAA